MSPLQLVFQFLSAAISVYMLLIIFRVLLSWFQGRINGKAIDILKSLTDPYLNRFQGISWLRFGMMDFSPVVGIAILGLLSQIFNSLALRGTFNPWDVVNYIIFTAWSLFSFMANIVIALLVFRLISLLFFKSWSHQILFQVDSFLYKVVAKVLGLFTSKKTKYTTGLAISAALIFTLRFAIKVGVIYLTTYLSTL